MDDIFFNFLQYLDRRARSRYDLIIRFQSLVGVQLRCRPPRSLPLTRSFHAPAEPVSSVIYVSLY